jgi:ferredoxin-NADP reductase
MAILRDRAAADTPPSATLLYSSRTIDHVIYRDELERLAENDAGLRVLHTLTREQPPGWTGFARRIDKPMLKEALNGIGPQPLTYICGPTLLVEAAANGLVDLGVDPGRIRTERFGPTN